MSYELDAKFREVMARKIEGTGLHNLDLFLLGEAVLNVVGASVTMGHTSPAHTLDYLPQPTETDHVSQHIVRDLLAWVSGNQKASPGCADRLPVWVSQEWLTHQTGVAATRLELGGGFNENEAA